MQLMGNGDKEGVKMPRREKDTGIVSMDDIPNLDAGLSRPTIVEL